MSATETQVERDARKNVMVRCNGAWPDSAMERALDAYRDAVAAETPAGLRRALAEAERSAAEERMLANRQADGVWGWWQARRHHLSAEQFEASATRIRATLKRMEEAW